MFKNSDDEQTFGGVIAAYEQEFGPENLIVWLPRRVSSALDLQMVHAPMAIKFWKRNAYSIRVKELSAGFDLTPED